MGKLQDFFKIFLCLVVFPATFYPFFITGHLSNVFLTNSEDLNSSAGATFQYVSFIIQVEFLLVLGISLFSLLKPILNISASEKRVDSEARLSLLVTWFWVRLIKLGCIFFGMLVLHQRMELIVNSSCEQQHELSQVLASNIGTMILVAGGVLIFTYVATFGNLAMVISVREEIGGSKALKRASQVLEGKKKLLVGFLMNLVLGVISVGSFLVYLYWNTCSKFWVEPNKNMMIIIFHIGIHGVETYTWILFTIFYKRCKVCRGHKFQPQESLKRILMEEEENESLI